MNWKWIEVGGDVKAHAAPETLEEAIIYDLQYRFRSPLGVLIDDTKTFTLDPGGMAWTTQKYQEFDIDGLKISVRNHDVGHFYVIMKNLKQRESMGRPYYKVHGWLHCLVLEPKQYEELLAALDAKTDLADELASKEVEEIIHGKHR